jgi:hypothetical protein
MMMADYSHQIDDLKAAAAICERHTIATEVNGVQSSYPRWPEAWAACETVWRNYLDMQTMAGENDEGDRLFIIHEASKLRR